MGATMSTEQLFGVDRLLNDDERAIAATVADFGTKRLRPQVAQWFEDGALPVRELALERGDLGLFGMHLDGYGCAGTSATAQADRPSSLIVGSSCERSKPFTMIEPAASFFPLSSNSSSAAAMGTAA